MELDMAKLVAKSGNSSACESQYPIDIDYIYIDSDYNYILYLIDIVYIL